MPFDFLRTYLHYNSGNECQKNYHIWSALVVLAAAVHKQVHVDLGYFEIYPNLFVCLVGTMGNRKSTAKDIAADLFMTTFPEYPRGSSVQSREAIVVQMADSKCLMTFKDTEGTIQEVRPIIFFVNELKNFLSVDPGKMIEFLTDIYDRKQFDSGTIKRGLEMLKNPCLNIIACETPEWITEKLKTGLMSGGIARRVVFIYETDEGKPIPFPTKPDASGTMFRDMRDHLRKVAATVGKFTWDKAAADFYADWYVNLKKPDDKIMAGYYRSKHIQAIKVAMLLALSTDPIRLVITEANFRLALDMLDAIEGNLPKLSQGAGRNELAPLMIAVIEVLEKAGGAIPEKVLKRLMEKDAQPMEQIQVLRYMQDTDQIVVKELADPKGVKRLTVMTKQYYEVLVEKNKKL